MPVSVRLRPDLARLLVLGAVACAHGCLEPGRPYLNEKDSVPPSVVKVVPERGQSVTKDTTIEITFTEAMDLRSLRPGIGLLRGPAEVETTMRISGPGPVPEDIEQSDVPFRVQVIPRYPDGDAGVLIGGVQYTIELRTLLTDSEGNRLSDDLPEVGCLKAYDGGCRLPFRTLP